MEKKILYKWIILIITFSTSMAIPIAMLEMPPLLPVLDKLWSIPLQTVSFYAITAYGIGIVIASFPFAFLSPRLGPKYAGIMCLFIAVIGTIINLLVSTIYGLFIGRIIEGIAFGLVYLYPISAFSVWFSREEMGLVAGIWSIFLPVSALLTFVLVPILISFYGLTSVYLFTFGWTLISLILWVIFFKLPSQKFKFRSNTKSLTISNSNIKNVILNRNVWLLVFIFFAFSYSFLGLTSYITTYFVTVGKFNLFNASTIGIIPVAVIIIAPFFGWLSDKTKSRKNFLLGGAAGTFLLSFIMLGLPFTKLDWIVYFIFLGAFWAMTPPIVFSMPSEIVAPNLTGTVSGFLSFDTGLALVLSSIIIGPLINIIGWQWSLTSLFFLQGLSIIAIIALKVK
ncbi:MAG: MFS transporter [Caldisphaera sp.]